MFKQILSVALLSASSVTLPAAGATSKDTSTYHLVVPLVSAASLGTGTFSLSSAYLTFDAIYAGSSSTSPVLITNTGKRAQSNPQIVIKQNTEEFSVSHDCPPELGVGASCTALVTFTAASNTEPGALEVSFTPAGTQTVQLHGAVALTPASLSGGATKSFGTLRVGQTAAQTWTITNSGQTTAPLTYGALPATITKSGSCGSELAGGTSCTVTLTWKPTAVGTLASTSVVVGDQNLVFSGTAQAPTVSDFSYTMSTYSYYDQGSNGSGRAVALSITPNVPGVTIRGVYEEYSSHNYVYAQNWAPYQYSNKQPYTVYIIADAYDSPNWTLNYSNVTVTIVVTFSDGAVVRKTIQGLSLYDFVG